MEADDGYHGDMQDESGRDRGTGDAILLSPEAKEALQSLNGDTKREIARWLRNHFRTSPKADPPLPIPEVDKEIRLALAPTGSAVVYRELDETEAKEVGTRSGYLVTNLIPDFTRLAAGLAGAVIGGRAGALDSGVGANAVLAALADSLLSIALDRRA